MYRFRILLYNKNKREFMRETMEEEKIIKIMHDNITIENKLRIDNNSA